MRRVSSVFLWGASVLFVTGLLQGQSRSTIVFVDDLVRAALERNRDFLATQQRLTEAQGLLRQAGVRLAPALEINTTTGRPLGTRGEEQYEVGYFHPIETAGKRDKRIAVVEKTVALAQAEVDERARQLKFEVTKAYFEALAARRKQATIERLLTVDRESYRVTNVRVEEGDAAPLERQLLATEMARVEAQVATFAGRAEAAIVDLRRIVGLPSTDEIAVPTDFTLSIEDRSLGQWQERALTQRADLRAARLSEDQTLAEVTLERAQGVPNVTASVRYARRNSLFDDQLALSPAGVPVNLRDRDNVLTFGVAIPLFSGRRNRGNIEAATARENAAHLRREFLESTIPAEVEAAYRRVTAAQRTLDLFERGVIAQSERNLTVIREAYTLGQLRVLDVLNEQRRLIDTELAYIDAQSDFAQALAELERTTGGNLP